MENLELLARDRIRDRAQRQDRSGIRRSARLIALRSARVDAITRSEASTVGDQGARQQSST